MIWIFRYLLGTVQARRKKIVAELNAKYRSNLKDTECNEIGYGRMVVNYPATVYADQPYVHWTPFLRNGRLDSVPDSDVSSSNIYFAQTTRIVI